MRHSTFKAATWIVTGLTMATVSMATVSVDWRSAESITGPVLDSGYVNWLPVGSIVQLIWSQSGTIPGINAGSPLSVATGGAEYLLNQQTTASAGFWNYGTANYSAENAPWNLSDDDFVGGYVYTRVFHDVAADGIDSSDYYAVSLAAYIGGPLGDVDPAVGQPAGATLSALYQSGTWGDDGQMNEVWNPIPEPTVAGLFALGMLSMAGMKKLRARK